METLMSAGKIRRKNGFKSYYVVWKLFLQKRRENIATPFKSYYVVWKPLEILFFIFSISMFKSYYVVWKQKKEDDIDFQRIMFKSYYVVWKRKFFHNKLEMHKCLNRTMQYGNKNDVGLILGDVACLNRTMQYGNFSHDRIGNQKLCV